jgi:hypothetical protein
MLGRAAVGMVGGGIEWRVQQGDLVNAQLLVAKRLLQRGQIGGERGVRIALVDGDGGTDAVSGNARVQFDGAEIVGLQGEVDFAVAGGLRELGVGDECFRSGGIGRRIG